MVVSKRVVRRKSHRLSQALLRFGEPVGTLQQIAEAEMGIGKIWTVRYCLPIGVLGLAHAPCVHEGCAQAMAQNWIARSKLNGRPDCLQRGGEIALLA